MCCGVMVAARFSGPCCTKSAASLVVMCSITTFRSGTFSRMGFNFCSMKTFSLSKKSTDGSVTSPCTSSSRPACMQRQGQRSYCKLLWHVCSWKSAIKPSEDHHEPIAVHGVRFSGMPDCITVHSAIRRSLFSYTVVHASARVMLLFHLRNRPLVG